MAYLLAAEGRRTGGRKPVLGWSGATVRHCDLRRSAGLHGATRSYSDSGEAALVCVSGAGGDVGEALRATPEQTDQELGENRKAWRAAEKALIKLRAGKEDAYQRAP